jgi:serine protease Do
MSDHTHEPTTEGTHSMRRLLVPLALLAVIATACSVSLGHKDDQASTTSTAGTDASSSLPTAKEPVEAVVRNVLPAVVNVTTDIFTQDQLGNPQQGQGVGTGFVVRSDGVIVTNCHVVEGASKITVSSSDEHPKEYDARLIGADCEHDLAVLKIQANGLATVPLGNSDDLQLGQRVVAIGYALALDGGPTVTTGIVSSLDRTIQAQDPQCTVCSTNASGVAFRTYDNVIQTDAAINHGNSGGPLVDMQGRVVGINSAGDDAAENIGFAIPIDSAKDTITQSTQDPLSASAYLGVSTHSVDGAVASQLGLSVDHGAYVLATTKSGPAADAGISDGDVIVSIDGQGVATSEDLGTILDNLEPGQRVSVEVVEPSGDQRSIDVVLGTRPLPTNIP